MKLNPKICYAPFLLIIAGCSSSDVSSSCTENEDCATGLCYAQSSPGYCTAACSEEGNTEQCPTDTVCKPILGGPARCLLICKTTADCPANSDCNSISNSSVRACEPVR